MLMTPELQTKQWLEQDQEHHISILYIDELHTWEHGTGLAIFWGFTQNQLAWG